MDNLRDYSRQQIVVPILEHSWLSLLAHAIMADTFFSHCSSCNESFPNIKVLVVPLLHVIAVHVHDKREPKLYSAGNNMDPGPVPPALQDLTQVEENSILL